MLKRGMLRFLALALLVIPSGSAVAQDDPTPSEVSPLSTSSERSPLSVQASLGFTGSPSTFLMALELPYSLTDHLSLGPAMQLGVDSNQTFFTFSANLRYAFDLSQALPQFEERDKLKPFVQGGIGLAHYSTDTRGRDRNETGFLLNMGFGIDYYLTEKIALGSNMLFNVIPGAVLGDRFVYSWQLASLRFHF